MGNTRIATINETGQLDVVLETLPVGVAIVDTKGGSIRSNAMFEKIWGGVPPSAHSIKDYAKYKGWWPDTGKQVEPEEWASALAVLKGKTVVGQIMEIERFDGTRAFVMNSASPILDGQGNITGAVVAIQDITGQKYAENQVISTAKFPTENPFPVLRLSGDGTILYSNNPGRVLLEQWGRQEGQKAPKDWCKLIFSAFKSNRYLIEEIACGERIFSFAITPIVDGGYVNLYGRDVTRQKQAEQSLLAEKNFTAAVLDTAGALVVVLDHKGHIIRFNRECEKVTGYASSEVLGRVFWEILICKKELNGVKQTWEKLQAGDFPSKYENHWIAKDGSRCLIAWTNTAIVGPEGEIEYIIGTGLDITEERESEKALREGQEDLNRAQAVGNIGSWRLDVRRNKLTWSEQNHRMFGVPIGTAMTYESFLDIVHPGDREYVDRQWKAALSGEPYDVEHRIVVAGNVRWVREKAYLEFGEDGSLLGGFGITHDITERKQIEQSLKELNQTLGRQVQVRSGELAETIESLQEAVVRQIQTEQALKESEQKYRNLVELSPEAISVAVGGKIAFMNTTSVKLLGGQNAEELIGRTMWDFIHPDSRPLIESDVMELVERNGEVPLREVKLIRLDGSTVEVEASAAAITHQGETGVQVIYHDITDRRRMEAIVQAEQKRLKELMEHLPAYIVLLTDDYHVPYANRFFREHFGESGGKRCYEYLFGLSEPCETCETFKVLKTRRPHEWQWEGPDGRIYHVFDMPFVDNEGATLILEMGIDVTELRRAEARRHVTSSFLELFARKVSRKDYLDSVIEIIRDWSGCRCVGIRLTNAQGHIPYESCVGFSEEFQIMESDLCLHKGDCMCARVVAQAPEPQDAALLTPHGSFRCENTFGFVSSLSEEDKKRFRGHCVKVGLVSLAVVPIRYREKVIGAIHLADEKENRVPLEKVEFLEEMAALVGEAVHRFDVEEAVRQSEQKFQLIAQSSEDLFWISTPGIKKMIYVSPAYETLWGRSCDSLYQEPQSFLDAVHSQDRDALVAGLAGHADGKWDFEYRIVRSDGDIRWVHDRGYPIFDEHGNFFLMTGIVRDITERKKAQEAILKQQEELRLLTTQLQLTEERERRQIAQDLHDSIGPILAFSTREIKMLKSTAPEPMVQSLEDISKQLDRAIKQTRTMSFDLSPSLLYDLGLEAAVEDMLERFAMQGKIRHSFKSCSTPKPLTDDVKVLLYRSVRELLINIVKHARANMVKVDLLRSNGDLYIKVEDDGCGLDMPGPAIGSKQVHGFGLFSIRERLKHIGGYMKIESAKGKGTKVMMIVPLDIKE